MTRTVSRALQPICTSTALGKDLVPRLGIATFERLREDMVRAGYVCRMAEVQGRDHRIEGDAPQAGDRVN